MTNRVWFDARSLSRGYTSGWERYVRELSRYLPNLIDITLWNPDVSNRLSLLLSDYFYQKSQIGHSLVHYPTYPPRKLNKNFKKIITVHDLTWWDYPQTSSFLGKFYYKKNMEQAILEADLIITPSRAIKSEINQKFFIDLNKKCQPYRLKKLNLRLRLRLRLSRHGLSQNVLNGRPISLTVDIA